jgi:hypothetical protein
VSPSITPIALGTALAICGAIAAQPLGTAEAHARTCASLSGKRLPTPSKAVKLVERGDEARGLVYACVPPRGRVHLLGVAHDETVAGAYEVTVLGSAGTWVAVDFRNQLDPHTYEDIGKTCDARSGRCYRFFAEGFPEPSLEAEVPQLRFSLERVVINGFGQSATALANYNTVEIVGYGSSGKKRLLAGGPAKDIPAASLELQGHTVRWTDAGVPRSAAP